MAAKKDFIQCAHCGRQQDTSDGIVVTEAGFRHIVTGNASHRISCFCGVMTRMFRFKQQLQVCWNSRPGKPSVVSEIRVTHPRTLNVDPNDVEDLTSRPAAEVPEEF